MLFGSACTVASKEAPPSSPQGAAKPTTKFTTVAEGCELLDRETIARYAPATACSLTLQDNHQTQNGDGEAILERWPRYEPAHLASQGGFRAVVEVGLKLNLDTYAENQESAARGTSGAGSSQRPVAGIGDKAQLYYRAGVEVETTSA